MAPGSCLRPPQNAAFPLSTTRFFENIPNEADDDDAVESTASTSASDRMIEATLAASAASVITIPTLGFVPFDREHRCGYSVAKYGRQNRTDPYSPDCGDGHLPDGATPITGNDPSDTSRKVGPEYAVAWLHHLSERHGSEWLERSFFALDNEPNYWADTHRDVHPQTLTYDELWSYTVSYSSALRAAYPKIRLAGPDYTGYQALSDPVDRPNGGSAPFLEAFVSDLAQHERDHGGEHLLDVLDIHCYPEGQWDATHLDPAADHMMRMRLTRELWDENFYVESWLARPTFYLRWAKRLIATHAPWLSLSCTEWNYQKDFKDDDVVGAVISLDAIGVFAREGVDLANKWSSPAPGSVAEFALLHFLHNFDGRGSTIAGAAHVEIRTSTELVGAHGFLSADGRRVHVLLICRQYEGDVRVEVQIPEHEGQWSLYRLDAQHISPSAPETISPQAGKVLVNMPPTSAVLVVGNKKQAHPPPPSPPPSPLPPPPSPKPPPRPGAARPPPLPPVVNLWAGTYAQAPPPLPRARPSANHVVSLTVASPPPPLPFMKGTAAPSPPKGSASVAAPLTLSVGIVVVIFFAMCVWVGRRLQLPTACSFLWGGKRRRRLHDDDDDAVSLSRRRGSRKVSASSEESVPSACGDDLDVSSMLPSDLLHRRVCLHGLSMASLNGSLGTATDFDAAAERFVVALDSGGTVKVKLANLELTDAERAQGMLGKRVRLHGLSTESLNKRCGMALSFDVAASRMVVQLEGDDARVVKLKLQNVERAAQSARTRTRSKSTRSKAGPGDTRYARALDDEESAVL